MNRQFSYDELMKTEDMVFVEAAREYERLIFAEMQLRKTDAPPVFSANEYRTANGVRLQVVKGGVQ